MASAYDKRRTGRAAVALVTKRRNKGHLNYSLLKWALPPSFSLSLLKRLVSWCVPRRSLVDDITGRNITGPASLAQRDARATLALLFVWGLKKRNVTLSLVLSTIHNCCLYRQLRSTHAPKPKRKLWATLSTDSSVMSSV